MAAIKAPCEPIASTSSSRAGAGGQRYASMALCEQITCVDKRFLVRGPLGIPCRMTC